MVLIASRDPHKFLAERFGQTVLAFRVQRALRWYRAGKTLQLDKDRTSGFGLPKPVGAAPCGSRKRGSRCRSRPARSDDWMVADMIVDTLPNQIVRYPDPRLRTKCAPIEDFDESLAALAERMLELMHAEHGVGLAGPQVGVGRQIFVCNPTGELADDRVFVNPELFDLVGAIEAEEGCLSIPDVHVIVRRARRCKMRAFDVAGTEIVCEAEDLLARIFQHETAHLNGGLIIDMMNAADKIANKKPLVELEAKYRKTIELK